MSVLVYIEVNNGEIKKSSLEASSYAASVAASLSKKCVAVILQSANNVEASLGKYGVEEIYQAQISGSLNPALYADAISEAAKESAANIVIISNTYTGKAISPRLAVKMDASICSNVLDLPTSTAPFMVKKGVFSGKAFAFVSLEKENKIIALTPNSIDLTIVNRTPIMKALQLPESQESSYEVSGQQLQTGAIPLTEAELVVSGGRGMKGPENWNLIEDLAKTLNAATACSKPVSDMEWRPHSEHVGQTGITIKPNLYIAIGISGAIQHLAGVSSSKVICVINKDSEAPFFKAADYGIVGDALEILPKLIAAAKLLS